MTKSSGYNNEFSQIYIESVFATWQMNNRPNLSVLVDMIEPDERGEKPKADTIAKWKSKYAWDGRDLAIQAEVQQKTDRELVNIRMQMMKRHAERAREIGEMAFDYLKGVGFDSSASAVSAAFKAFAEEKQSTGMEVALAQVFTMTDEDLQREMNRLLGRVKDLQADGEVVEGTLEEGMEDATSDG